MEIVTKKRSRSGYSGSVVRVNNHLWVVVGGGNNTSLAHWPRTCGCGVELAIRETPSSVEAVALLSR